MAATTTTATTATAPPAPMSHRQVLVVMGALMSGLLLAALDQTIVSTALPTIVGELGGLDHLSWVVTSYLLTSTAGVPLFGKVSDLYGRRVVFQAAIAVFLAGSVLAGLSQSMLQLIVFRGLQGVGGGGLMAMTFVIIGDIVPPRERGRYTGYLTGVFAMASVIGPLLGGFFVDVMTWRWIFYINLPIGVLALVVASRHLDLPVPGTGRRIDLIGAVLLVASVSCLLLVAVWGGQEHEWTSSTILGLSATGLVLGAAFVAQERRAPEPLVPLRLFAEPVFRVSILLGFLIGCAMFGGMIFLPLYLQVVTGASATSSGLLLLPMMGGVLLGSVSSGRLTSRTGRYKIFPIVGTAVAAGGMWLLSLMDASTGRLHSSVAMLVLGAGLGSVMPILMLAVQNAAPMADLGVATAAVNFFRSLGGAFGVAVFGAVLNSRLGTELAARLPGLAEGRTVDRSLLNSPEQIRALPEPVADAVIGAVAASVHTVFVVATPVLLAAFAVAWLLRELPLRTTVHHEAMGDAAEVAEEAGVPFEPAAPEAATPLH